VTGVTALALTSNYCRSATKAQTRTQTDITSMVLIWTIILLGMFVLVLLLADQGFSSPPTDWECFFKENLGTRNKASQ
jgi:hypothetical protein